MRTIETDRQARTVAEFRPTTIEDAIYALKVKHLRIIVLDRQAAYEAHLRRQTFVELVGPEAYKIVMGETYREEPTLPWMDLPEERFMALAGKLFLDKIRPYAKNETSLDSSHL